MKKKRGNSKRITWKKGLGIVLLFVGVIFSFASRTFTGAVIGVNPLNIFGIFGILSFIAGLAVLYSATLEDPRQLARQRRLEEIAEGIERDSLLPEETHEAHNAANYERLKARLKFMQDYKHKGLGKEVPIGRYLSVEEEESIREIILKHLPDKLKKQGIEIYVSGSLSRKKKGERMEKFGVPGFSSDQFYLSDVDIGIVGRNPFDYIESNWEASIVRSLPRKGGGRTGGALRGKATYSISTGPNDQEMKLGYMESAPDWIKDMILELSKYNYAGEKRPVNLKFYRDSREDLQRDVLYKKD